MVNSFAATTGYKDSRLVAVCRPILASSDTVGIDMEGPDIAVAKW